MLDDNYDILLIDDDTDVLEAYCMLLEQAGYRVYACHDPLAAKELVHRDWCGIVLSDVCMPVLRYRSDGIVPGKRQISAGAADHRPR